MEIFNHVLIGKEVSHLPCLKNKLPLEEPDTIVVHYTAGSSARGRRSIWPDREWTLRRTW